MKILVATDAWHPQVNGVVRTLTMLAESATVLGVEISFLTPDSFRTVAMPSYPDLRVALPRPAKIARLIAEPLSEKFGQQFYIEYHPGSSGTIGAGLTARAAPDGYTLMIGGSGPHITSPAINPNVGYDPLKDFSHIAMVEHWRAGTRDVHLSMRHKDWLERPQSGETMVTYDLTGDGTEPLDGNRSK